MKYGSLLLLLLSACSSSSSAVREFLGPDIAHILEDAERIESIRVDGSLGVRGAEGEKIDDFPITARGPELTPAQSASLRTLIFDGANWNFNIAKACEFSPGVSFRFIHDEDQVDVLLCFSCDEWGFFHGGRMRIEDNDAARSELLRLAREAFPEDSVLRGLK